MQSCARIMLVVVISLAAACARVDQMPGAASGGRSGAATGSGGNGSGSMTGTSTGGMGVGTGSGGDMRGTMSNGGMGGEASCGMEFFQLTRQPPDVMLVLDRSASMKKNAEDEEPTGANDPRKWDQVVPALSEVIPQAGANISWGMKAFPEDDNDKSCTPATVTPKIDVPVAKMNAAGLVTAINAVTPEGDGTPTGAAVQVATDYLKSIMDGNPKYLLLATDGQPSCAGAPGALTGKTDTEGARTSAVTAVTAAAALGIHTFVVGVATSKENDAATLNMLATAGLEPRADPNPLATKFYLTTSKAELVAAMQAISNKVDATCVFPLSKAPPVPENIAVKVSGVKSPFDSSSSNGWNYTGADRRAVEVFGSWCEMIKQNANQVEIIFGCPNIPIP